MRIRASVVIVSVIAAASCGGDEFDQDAYEDFVEVATADADVLCPDVRVIEREPGVAERTLGVTSLEEFVRVELAREGVTRDEAESRTEEMAAALRDVCERSLAISQVDDDLAAEDAAVVEEDVEEESFVRDLARGAPGCTTTLSFTDTGTYYIYEETGALPETSDGCSPTVTPNRAFAFVLDGPSGAVTPTPDRSQSYSALGRTGVSVARFEITEPGDYELSVVGDDPRMAAAIGGPAVD